MLADQIVLSSDSREAVQTSVKWRHALKKKKGMKVRSKAQYMAVNKKIDGQLSLQKVKIKN